MKEYVDLDEWIQLMQLARKNGVTVEQVKNFIEGRNDDEDVK
ncbi:DNA-binding anti-repressor SinI [Gracilibacillus thailandensis]|uniref:DNA-binding anti-repressor SinI n=1 Tax=Gracilibacillus thailandensis TaxID=563735 RepID=A0A6N7QSM4_9BACI|nr:DNA-binding anti-repressor SinI [Gracilibacillus thailandensis]MRI65117.1 DNA-binding anti-repressor SinI [Gracilibacillus thailandensis]